MLDFLAHLFDTSGFPPRWQCGTWTPAHGWLHITADLVIFSAYFAIPVVLWHFARRRADWPFRHLLWLFGAFILACGTTHLMEAVMFWWPAYRLVGVLKAVTAVVSWVTVAALVPVLPRALAMRTPEELGREVAARQAAEAGLVKANAELESQVRERMAELTAANLALAAERERFRTTLASIGDGVIATDTAGRVTFLNPAAESQTGWSTANAAGQPVQTVFRIVNETSRQEIESPAMRALRDGVMVGLANHTVLIGRDGGERPIDDCAAPIRDEAGGVAGAVLVFRDVSERRRAEVVQAEQARLTALRADIATALAADRPKAVALQACCEAVVGNLGAAFARIWTLPNGSNTLELLASAGLYTHLDGPHGRVLVGQFKIGRIAATGEPHLTNSVADDPNVSDREWAVREGIVAFAGHPLEVEGRVVGVMALFARQPLSPSVLDELARLADAIAQYIDRRRAEEQIRESEERYRLFFEASPLPMWVYDRDSLAFLEVNNAAVAKYGYSRAEFLSLTVIDIRPSDEVPALLAVMATTDGPSEGSVWRHRLRDGRAIRVRVVTHNITFRGRLARVVQAQDVTEQLRAEEELRASEERFRAFMDHSPAAAWITDPDGRMAYLSASYRRTFHLPPGEIVGRPLADLYPPDVADVYLRNIRAVADSGTMLTTTEPAMRADGTSGEFLVYKFPLPGADGGQQVGGVALDVTDLRAAEAALRASEERFRQAFDFSAIGMALVAPDGRFLRVNAAMGAVFGCSEAELLGTDCVTLTAPDDRVADKEWVEPMLAGKIEAYTLEKRYIKGDGRSVWVQLTISLVRDAASQPVYFVAQFQDISARRDAELSLRASEVRLQLALSAGGMGTFDWDIDGGGIVWSDSHYELFGYDPDDPFPVGFRQFSDRIHPDDLPDVECKLREAMSTHSVFAHEYRFCRPDGGERWLAGTGRYQYHPAGRAIRMVGVVQDISARKAAELAVRASERLLRQVIDTDPNFIVVKDRDGRFTLANLAFAEAYGTTVDRIVGKSNTDIHPISAECAAYMAADLRVFATGDEFNDPEEPFTTPQGKLRWLRTTKRLLADEHGNPPALLAVSVDITAQKAATDALAASNRLYRLLADHVRDVVMLAAVDGCVAYVSPSCERASGYTPAEVQAHGMWHVVHPDDVRAAENGWNAAIAGRAGTVEWRCQHRDGRELWMETLLTPVADGTGMVTQVVASGRDISTRKVLEVQVRQAQKLEAIGQLAGGVAHDFNNLLTVVNGCGELLLADLPPDSSARPLAEAIIEAGERGAGLTRQLLAFSRQQMLRVEVFDPNRVLTDTAKLLTRLLGEDIALRLALDPAAGSIKADIGQVDQVIINLAVNARDAMPTGGTLVIETSSADLAADNLLPSPDARPGRYVRLAVTDTGTGITSEVQARLFEPFFTTKPAGKGTGLGLATVYGIVRQSGGFITVESKVGQGTTFAVYLPRHEAEPDAPKSVLRSKPRAAGTETVLLVEDDEAVRTLATTILVREGYRVVAAEDGDAALAVCKRLTAPPDVVLTDVVMPGMSGRELAETLIVRYPLLKVVFLSGYTADDILRHGIEEESVAFLQKPYSPDSLARFVRQVLDGTSKN